MGIEEYSDKEIVRAILNRNTIITKEFLYRKCYPLFSSVYGKYYTDCDNVFEFINEIFLYIMTPNRSTGRCKLVEFKFKCSLMTWLKIIAENFCHQLYKKKKILFSPLNDKFHSEIWPVEIDFSSLNKQDVKKVIDCMPNKRYGRLIELKYLHNKTNEEIAKLMGMTMENYYNVHLRAKTQFFEIIKREGLL